jgi:hypothetical protein
MPDDKDPKSEPCDSSRGTSVPVTETRITNFAERAQQRENRVPRRTKLPPRPGRLPENRHVDATGILNRDDTDEG